MVIIDGIKLQKTNQVLDGLAVYKLLEEHRDDVHDEFLVPEGFHTNGVSVPALLRRIIRPLGEMFRASVVHDYLYTAKPISRKQADYIFSRIVIEDTGNRIVARLAYYTLRVFGRRAWRRAKVK